MMCIETFLLCALPGRSAIARTTLPSISRWQRSPPCAIEIYPYADASGSEPFVPPWTSSHRLRASRHQTILAADSAYGYGPLRLTVAAIQSP